ncbi:hypothetical protein [Pectinatus frisingensis]|uniref:hypothetical protein n=1 Tax=Pectinatus frisingensis TaxID=865 RepID=UPI0018C5C23D|nr:hypothetical protein [Pectinatus frisingensis]
MKILYLGIFDDHELGGDIVLRKGFLQNNCEVESLDYRKLFSINNIDVAISKILLIARGKDLVFVGKGELITPILLKKLKKIGISTALWYGDII